VEQQRLVSDVHQRERATTGGKRSRVNLGCVTGCDRLARAIHVSDGAAS
jgi:hypothetical protein